MVEWTPSDNPVLITSASATNDVVSVSAASAEEPFVVEVSFTPIQMPALGDYSVSVSGTSCTVTFHRYSQLWALELEYLLNGQLYTTDSWELLPDEAEDVIGFRPEATSEKMLSFAVTALDDGGATLDTKVYEVQVIADFTPGRDALVSAVEARS